MKIIFDQCAFSCDREIAPAGDLGLRQGVDIDDAARATTKACDMAFRQGDAIVQELAADSHAAQRIEDKID